MWHEVCCNSGLGAPKLMIHKSFKTIQNYHAVKTWVLNPLCFSVTVPIEFDEQWPNGCQWKDNKGKQCPISRCTTLRSLIQTPFFKFGTGSLKNLKIAKFFFSNGSYFQACILCMLIIMSFFFIPAASNPTAFLVLKIQLVNVHGYFLNIYQDTNFMNTLQYSGFPILTAWETSS